MDFERIMAEKEAKFYISEIIIAIDYLHQLDIIYRDLKLENVMLDKHGHVKLIDFGLSRMNVTENALATTFCGTLEYMAPEVFQKEGYGKPSDWWSLGVFTHDIMSGYTPFQASKSKSGDRKSAIKKKVMQGLVNIPLCFSSAAAAFVRDLLIIQVSQRLGSPGASKIKSHWFFEEINWSMVLNKSYEPPFFPAVTNEEDVKNFDTTFTNQSAKESIGVLPTVDKKHTKKQNLGTIHEDGASVPNKSYLEKYVDADYNFKDYYFVSKEFRENISYPDNVVKAIECTKESSQTVPNSEGADVEKTTKTETNRLCDKTNS